MPLQKKSSDSTIQSDLTLYIEILDSFGPLGKPAVRFSKFISDKESIERLLKKALDDEFIIAKITLNNKKLAVPRLVRLGLVDPDNL